MLVGGLRQSTLFKQSVFGSCGFLTFCPTGRHRGLVEHMFNSTCSAPSFTLTTLYPFINVSNILLVNHFFFLSIFPFFPFPYTPSPPCMPPLLFGFHFPFALSQFPCPSFHPPFTPQPLHPGLLERAAKEPEGAQNVARPAGERCSTGSGD